MMIDNKLLTQSVPTLESNTTNQPSALSPCVRVILTGVYILSLLSKWLLLVIITLTKVCQF